jgi:RNA polymerase sigma-70 factor, ECF subfamily
VRGWLYRATIHRIHQHRRSFARFASMLVRNAGELVATSAGQDAAEALERRQHAARIRRCVLELPFACREAFVLFDLEGLSTREVATLLDVPEGTVSSRVSAARAKFRERWLAQEHA